MTATETRQTPQRWLYRVVRKHAGKQQAGWSFTMLQLHEKSGSPARLSDFALDVRKVIEAHQLPEYELSSHRNAEGEEIVNFVHRTHLAQAHPRKEFPRFPGRRKSSGIFAEALDFKGLDDPAGEEDSVY